MEGEIIKDAAGGMGDPRAVFLSYASMDADVAGSICQFLESHGVSCWMAPRDVAPGALYADAIIRGINNAKAVVLVLSGSAVGSAHVGKEIERASSKKKRIIAFRVDAAALNPALEYFLSESQWIDVPALGMPAALAKLAEAVTLGSGLARAADSVAAGKLVLGAGGRDRRVAVGAAAILVGVGLAVAVGGHFWRSSHRAAAPPVAAGEGAKSSPSATTSDKSIAVLPFADMSEKHDQEYFADGMAEAIIDLLARIPGLKVIGRTSSFQFEGRNEDLRTIGAKLNAAHVLEGSVRKMGDQIRITAQLINAQLGTHEWSETYDQHVDDVFRLQDAIAAAVAREMQLTVSTGRLDSRATSKSVDAYDLTLRARHSADRWDKDGLDEAISLLNQALVLDPTFADAAAELAFTYQKQGLAGFILPTPAAENARGAAKRAMSSDAKNTLAHFVLGSIDLVYDWDWAAADREFSYVETLAPGNADALNGKALLALTLGHGEEALVLVKAALVRDPLNPWTLYTLSTVHIELGHLPEAEAAACRVLEIRPSFPYAHWAIAVVSLLRGDREGALSEMLREPTHDGKQAGLAMIYHALGRKADSDAALASLINERAEFSVSTGIAEVYAYRGQYDEAMNWLERAYDQKDSGLMYVKVNNARFMPANNARFKAFLKKMNLPE